MVSQGAALQKYNTELVKCFEDFCKKREELQRCIHQEEEEKAKVERDILLLKERLAAIKESLALKYATKKEYDETIAESEAAYLKIIESSQSLLTVLRTEGQELYAKAPCKRLGI